ncbi:MAG: hypothetical protein ACYSUU_08740, partial [Planctomycetota bacterium]
MTAGPACWKASPGRRKNPALSVVPVATAKTPKRFSSFLRVGVLDPFSSVAMVCGPGGPGHPSGECRNPRLVLGLG